MKLLIWIIIALICFPRYAFSAILNCKSEVKDAINGKTICVLEKGTFVREVERLKNDYRIEIDLYTNIEDFRKLSSTNIKIEDRFNRIVGTTENYMAKDWDFVDTEINKGRLFIEGFINKDSLDQDSLISVRIRKFMNKNIKIDLKDVKSVFADWIKYGISDVYKGKEDEMPNKMQVLILFNSSVAQYIPKIAFGFFNDELFVIGANENYESGIDTIKQNGKVYYILRDYSKNMEEYLKPVFSRFEYVP